MKPVVKKHNSPGAEVVKVDLRRRVLEHVHPARVLDAFCGPDGMMWDRVWRGAAHYVGIDKEWKPTDPRRRFVGDNAVILRSIDLGEFNVFDFDAFGSPWGAALILAGRRRWAPGERGALVLTDGASQRMRFGGQPKDMRVLTGIRSLEGLTPRQTTADALQRLALQRWPERAGVRVLHRWEAHANGTQRGTGGGIVMLYAAMVFEGTGDRG